MNCPHCGEQVELVAELTKGKAASRAERAKREGNEGCEDPQVSLPEPQTWTLLHELAKDYGFGRSGRLRRFMEKTGKYEFKEGKEYGKVNPATGRKNRYILVRMRAKGSS
jgi:hypothetical protein